MVALLVQPLPFLPSSFLSSAVFSASMETTVNFVAEVFLTVGGWFVGRLTLTGSPVEENTGQSSTISLPLLFTSVQHARED